jgi:hypothetical protein
VLLLWLAQLLQQAPRQEQQQQQELRKTAAVKRMNSLWQKLHPQQQQ